MKNLILIFTALVLLGTASLRAGNAGTDSPFSFGAGGRELSMGSADLATCDFEAAPFWNPSRLAHAEQYQIGGFHSQLFGSDAAYQYLGVIAPTLDFGTFGIGIFRLGVSNIEVRDVNNFLLGQTDDNRLAIMFAYARSSSSFDYGAAITFEHQSLAGYSATSSPGVNLSVSKTLFLKSNFFRTMTVSLNGSNVIKPSIELDAESVTYPVSGAISLSLGIKPMKDPGQNLILAATIRKTDKVDPEASVGLEYSFSDMLFLRTGLNDGKFAAGIGLRYAAFSFDYAVIDRDLDLLHTFTLTTSFGKPVSQRKEERVAKRENEFNRLMGERLTERNRGLVEEMITEGKQYVQDGRLTDAVSTFERALFMARANSFDTTDVSTLLNDSRTQLEEILTLKQFRESMDSANVALNREDYISAKYFATTALDLKPNSVEPQNIISKAEEAINRNTAREEQIRTRLAKADSLLNIGRIAEAINLLSGLKQTFADDSRVSEMYRKAQFERLREKATNSYTQHKYGVALAALDSALVLFPNHEWCLKLKASILSTQSIAAAKNTAKESKPAKKPSEQLLKEAEQEYKTAQSLFTSGNLSGAIVHWENVERLVPDYQSVREYLLKAYKFLGVEKYSKGELREAITIWEKALSIAPDNEEIRNYIQRTETELKKLEQLSYESK